MPVRLLRHISKGWLLLWLCGTGLGLGGVYEAAAQWLSRPGLYLDARLGVNSYGGERREEAGFHAFAPDAGSGFGLEAGRYLSDRMSAGLFYFTGRYPALLNLREGQGRYIDPIQWAESSDWIHMLGLVGRFHLWPDARLSPYGQAGITAGLSLLNEHVLLGVGPRLGVGLDVGITRAVALFMEMDGVFIAPGNAMDLAGTMVGADGFALFGAGLRYRVPRRQTGPVPIQVYNLFGPDRLTVGEQGLFAADVNLNEATAPVRYRWDFGDGTSVYRMVAVHAFDRPGTYTVTLEASNEVATEARTMTVEVAAPIVPAEIMAVQAFPLRPKVGQPVQFTATVRGTEPITCRWAFGDGGTSEECHPVHQYATSGSFNVTLEVSNAAGVRRATREVGVAENPCIDLSELAPVFFERNRSELSVDARGFLRENIARLIDCSGFQVEVNGYAAPGEANPQQLSEARAMAVTQYYQNLGIAADRIVTHGRGTVREIPDGDAIWQYRFVQSLLRAE